jgi:hypothetical protein
MKYHTASLGNSLNYFKLALLKKGWRGANLEAIMVVQQQITVPQEDGHNYG